MKKKSDDINEERVINSLLINDVVTEPRMKFFREPILGCYLALDFSYETSMSYNSLVLLIVPNNMMKKNQDKKKDIKSGMMNKKK